MSFTAQKHHHRFITKPQKKKKLVHENFYKSTVQIASIKHVSLSPVYIYKTESRKHFIEDGDQPKKKN